MFGEDARDAQAFVDRWRPRTEAMSDARHRRMLQVILGEALEQKRFFEQALAGRTDLLGLRSEQVGPAGRRGAGHAVGRVTAAVAIGSNLGDRAAHLAFARARLAALLSDCRFSTIHETEPVGVSGIQPAFLNAAAVGVTDLTPQELLAALLAIEQARGRRAPRLNAPRTLDLDLVLHGEHRRRPAGADRAASAIQERLFVLEPLSEIAPAMVDPMTRKSVAELLQLLRRSR